jgi:hypothetical protein
MLNIICIVIKGRKYDGLVFSNIFGARSSRDTGSSLLKMFNIIHTILIQNHISTLYQII